MIGKPVYARPLQKKTRVQPNLWIFSAGGPKRNIASFALKSNINNKNNNKNHNNDNYYSTTDNDYYKKEQRRKHYTTILKQKQKRI